MVPTSKAPPSYLFQDSVDPSTQSPFGILPLPHVSLSGFAFSVLASALPLFEASSTSNVLLLKLNETLSLSLSLFLEPEALYIDSNFESKSNVTKNLECQLENKKRVKHILSRFEKVLILFFFFFFSC